MPLEFIIPLVVIIVIADIAVLVVILRAIKGKRDVHMLQLGERFGLGVTGGEPLLPQVPFLKGLRKPVQLVGEYRGRLLKIYHYTVGSGKNSTTYATARIVGFAGNAITFEVRKEGVISKLGKVVGIQDVRVGDERFDKLFFLKASDPDFIAVTFLPEIRTEFYRVWEELDAKGTIRLDGEELRYDETGKIHNDAGRLRFEAVVDLLTDLAKAVAVYRSSVDGGNT
jgi:hypothetical protein